MAERILGEQGSRRRRRFLILPLLLCSAVALFLASGAQAVHDLQFQLDGDTSTARGTTPSAAQTVDWDSVFNADGSNTALINPTGGPGSFTNADFTRDFRSGPNCTLDSTSTVFCTSDTTTFATGSKDTLDISGWACNRDANVNSKIDIMNAYATAFTNTDGHKLLYFGLEKNANNGTNDVGFWFLQGNADCDASGGGHPTWSGHHTVGDVLVVSEFSAGGGVSSIFAYEYVGGANPLILFGSGGDCKTNTTGGDAICATTNSGSLPFNGNITTKWLTADKRLGVGHTVVPPDFFEGGIDLTSVFNSVGGTVPSCFNTFIGDTRSSTSLTATLFDYARGTLGECNATLTTTPSTSSTPLASTDPVTDTANIQGHTTSGGTPPSPTGTVNFFLCNTSQLTTNGVADPTNGVCEGTNGTAVAGNPVTATPGSGGASSATSGNARPLITALGRYCFRAEFTVAATDPNYPPGAVSETDNLTAECFTVTGAAHLSTAQNWTPQDTATITGDAAFSGNLTFNLYHSTDCTGTAVYTEGPTAVSGPGSGATFHTNNATFHVSLANANTGDYSWGVTYSDTSGLTSPGQSCEPSSVSITAGG